MDKFSKDYGKIKKYTDGISLREITNRYDKVFEPRVVTNALKYMHLKGKINRDNLILMEHGGIIRIVPYDYIPKCAVLESEYAVAFTYLKNYEKWAYVSSEVLLTPANGCLIGAGKGQVLVPNWYLGRKIII